MNLTALKFNQLMKSTEAVPGYFKHWLPALTQQQTTGLVDAYREIKYTGGCRHSMSLGSEDRTMKLYIRSSCKHGCTQQTSVKTEYIQTNA
jgi:hypothetical protein